MLAQWLATAGGMLLCGGVGFALGVWYERHGHTAEVVAASTAKVEAAADQAAHDKAELQKSADKAAAAVPTLPPEQVVAELERLK